MAFRGNHVRITTPDSSVASGKDGTVDVYTQLTPRQKATQAFSNMLSDVANYKPSAIKAIPAEHIEKLGRWLAYRPSASFLRDRNILLQDPTQTVKSSAPLVTKWSLSLEDLLQCETGIDYFRIFLALEQKLPMIYFILAVIEYEKSTDYELLKLAKQIMNTYIMWDTPNTVPISEECKMGLSSAYTTVLSLGVVGQDFRWIFSAAKNEVIEETRTDLYPRFLRSETFQAAIKGHSLNPSKDLRPDQVRLDKGPLTQERKGVAQKGVGADKKKLAFLPSAFSGVTKLAPPSPSTPTASFSLPSHDLSRIACTSSDLDAWAGSFEQMMTSEKGVMAFRIFLSSEKSLENLDFYSEVLGFKASPKHLLTSNFNRIYESYIPETAPCSVNISSSTKIILDKIYAHSKSMPDDSCISSNVYDAAQSEIRDLMQSDSYRRFLKSNIFKELRATAIDIETKLKESATVIHSKPVESTGCRVVEQEAEMEGSKDTGNLSSAQNKPNISKDTAKQFFPKKFDRLSKMGFSLSALGSVKDTIQENIASTQKFGFKGTDRGHSSSSLLVSKPSTLAPRKGAVPIYSYPSSAENLVNPQRGLLYGHMRRTPIPPKPRSNSATSKPTIPHSHCKPSLFDDFC